MSITNTFTFNKIFSSYNEYKDFTIEINLYTPANEDFEIFNQWCFESLMYRFNHQEINYDVIEIFLTEFANLLLDHFNQYYKQKKLIDEIYKFNLDEFSRVTEQLSSEGRFNSSKLVDPKEWISYVGNQIYTNNQLSKFDGYIKGISQMPSYNRKVFTDKFVYLFKQFHTPTQYIFNKNKGIWINE